MILGPVTAEVLRCCWMRARQRLVSVPSVVDEPPDCEGHLDVFKATHGTD